MEKVNDYDAVAKERQERFLKGESKPHRFVEKPAMRQMLPPLEDREL
jgi:hypothetical protein